MKVTGSDIEQQFVDYPAPGELRRNRRRQNTHTDVHLISPHRVGPRRSPHQLSEGHLPVQQSEPLFSQYSTLHSRVWVTQSSLAESNDKEYSQGRGLTFPNVDLSSRNRYVTLRSLLRSSSDFQARSYSTLHGRLWLTQKTIMNPTPPKHSRRRGHRYVLFPYLFDAKSLIDLSSSGHLVSRWSHS